MPNQLTPEILKQIMPTLSLAKRQLYAPLLESSMIEFGITNERRVSAYLANLAHESKNLTKWEENLNYRAQRLTEVWPNRFPTLASAQPFAHNPEALANKVYGGRMGNNNTGDGWKYRGRFPIQATGKGMYAKAAKALGIPELLTDPDWCLNIPMIGFRISAWIFAKEKGGNQLADRQQLRELTYVINGGYHGLQERIDLYNRAMRVLPDGFVLKGGVSVAEEEDEPDFIDENESSELMESTGNEKGVTTSSKPTDETEGTPPPAKAVEVKASKPSWWSKITALSMPTIPTAVAGAIWTFVSGMPPWGWIVIGAIVLVGLVLGAWLYNESMKRAHGRTLTVLDAAADKDKNNLRLI